MKNQEKWRRLDNSAKLFPIVGNKKFSSIYRMSVVLTEEINPETLKQAVENTLQIFTTFKVCLKRGFFWYYLEQNEKEVVVFKEDTYPCRYMDKRMNHGYLFKVSYFKNKINLEVFHALTDGGTAIEFLKVITYHYLNLQHPNTFKEPFTVKNAEIDARKL